MLAGLVSGTVRGSSVLALLLFAGLVFSAEADPNAFSRPFAGINSADLAKFNYGRGLFHHVFEPIAHADGSRTGLGALHNAASCADCHIRDGRGLPYETGSGDGTTGIVVLLRGTVGGPYGNQLQDRAIPGTEPEASLAVSYAITTTTLADGTVVPLRAPRYDIASANLGPLPEGQILSPRIAPPVFGLGLIAAVPDAEILAAADPDDLNGDGISGRPAYGADGQLGRFGWKAESPTLFVQTLKAASEDMGLTVATADLISSRPELDATQLALISHYVAFLGVPTPGPEPSSGRTVFNRIGCAACHVARLAIDPDQSPEPGADHAAAYSDFLLHDMGPGLADPGGVAAAEWRTAPLWGIGHAALVAGGTAYYLHDGRARDLTEAILWHGGEAEAARDRFAALDASEREALIGFLETL